ncbi:hypothetical protein NQ315_003569 [Exocentrus adspersus]|uniref:THAP-type domain-containing protein n=1 Tax=Exocentrus adspersus TaxID=1586481 RepID=A0AAV8V5V8_9CUCU|nr:hypothetical protein NQ315_003569 [Exocentrus adspersus]
MNERKIPRKDRKLSPKDVVCEKHFSNQFVIREIETSTYWTDFPYNKKIRLRRVIDTQSERKTTHTTTLATQTMNKAQHHSCLEPLIWHEWHAFISAVVSYHKTRSRTPNICDSVCVGMTLL